MKIGFVGVGKLGMPVALAMEAKGHDVMVYDTNESAKEMLEKREFPHQEIGVEELMKKHTLKWAKYQGEIIEHSEIIFLAIQTPHDIKYEGITRIPEEREDFDYKYLKEAVSFLADKAQFYEKETTLVIISTVLPGTIDKKIRELLNSKVRLAYNPYFIAMGTVILDFLNPEFVLLGTDDQETANKVKEFYTTIHSKPVIEMPIRDAELTKVAYNTFIGMKIVFANTMMEICHINEGNVDNVMGALKKATDRLISPKYLNAGMGDGGGCHPRDNIAMSYLAKKLKLSHNFFDDLMKAREDQTDFIADLAYRYHLINRLPIIILGKAFKPETDLETGSPAILLHNLLRERGIHARHYGRRDPIEMEKGVYVIATQHKEFVHLFPPEGSVIIDPFGYIEDIEGVSVIRIGRKT